MAVSMSRLRLVLRTLWYFRFANLAVAASVAVGTAVLVGSLVVGDSVRGSLTDIVMRRLGDVDHAVVAPNLFRDDLGGRLKGLDAFSERFDRAQTVMFTNGSAKCPQTDALSSRVNVFGATSVANGTCVLSVHLAQQLHAGVGETIVLRMDPMNSVSSELPVGVERTEVALLRLTVARIAESGGFEDSFSLHGGQRPVRNAWVSLAELQRALEIGEFCNLMLVAAKDGHESVEDADALEDMIRRSATLDDYGLKLLPVPGGALSLEARSILLFPRIEQAALKAWPEATRVMAYLATTVRDVPGARECPYAMVAGMSSLPSGPIPLGAIVLNAWTADDLGAAVGHEIQLAYVVRTGTGLLEEETASFVVSAIIPMDGIGADGSLVPEFKGLTDADSVSNWDPPRDLRFNSERIRQKDEDYWERYRAAPKAFVNLEDAFRLWGTEFGRVTSVRIPAGTRDEAIDTLLQTLTPTDAGLVAHALRSSLLAGAAGNTDFGQLFIGFNFFLVISAALLVNLIVRLSIDQRTRQVGVLYAVGFRPTLVHRIFVAEATAVIAAGVIAGAGASLAYAHLMIVGLRTIWIGAVGTSLLSVSAQPATVCIGSVAVFVVGVLAARRGLRRIRHLSVVSALAGRAPTGRTVHTRAGRRAPALGAALVLLAVGAALAAMLTSSLNTTAAFFISGISLLAASFAFTRWRLALATNPSATAAGMTLFGLASRNASRNSTRSVLTAGLIASASFMTIAVGSMKAHDSIARAVPGEGMSGFTLLAEFDIPIPYDLNDPASRSLMAVAERGDLWKGVGFANMMVSSGEDVSCKNLYSPGNPRVSSVPHAFVERNAFAFAEVQRPAENPWSLLDEAVDGAECAAILDYGTARWIMHLNLGDVFTVTDEHGADRRLRIVALLKPSIFQSEVLVSEWTFKKLFPSRSGFGQFLCTTPPEKTEEVRAALSRDLVDFGVSVEGTNERLAAFAEIADSYIDAFEALGSLGLMLGSLGLVVVLVRSVIERRSELALLSAIGMKRGRISGLLSLENALLLAIGLASGVISAVVAVSPEFIKSGGKFGSMLVAVGVYCAMVAIVTGILAAVSYAAVRRIGSADLRIE
jgi:putative ABC transport system permease protein